MTKASRIMALHALGLSTRDIAQAVYDLHEDHGYTDWDRRMSYVRVVTRQRKDGKGTTPADAKWRQTESGAAKRRAQKARYIRKRADRYRREKEACAALTNH